ncbi:hypothetical protein [Tardiphaga sp.]|uniref:hypothetical protein n=1 Tax=Tardiphaga sp. TaxID=1926292 RepID=UPI0026095EFD|nr:hypothetical protein [Tardiphaga sp.]MDB5616724.1 hypothetical protein [Tardiphaga sp.]
MPDAINNPEPAPKPAWASIPPFKTIIEEGTEEIKREANALVELTLDSAKAADPKILRKWGDDGARYFFKRLKARVKQQVGVAAATRAIPGVAKVAAPAGRHALPTKATAVVAKVRTKMKLPWKAALSISAKAPVVAVKNWQAQQRYRSSYVAAATTRGLLAAVILTIGAIIVLRLMA